MPAAFGTVSLLPGVLEACNKDLEKHLTSSNSILSFSELVFFASSKWRKNTLLSANWKTSIFEANKLETIGYFRLIKHWGSVTCWERTSSSLCKACFARCCFCISFWGINPPEKLWFSDFEIFCPQLECWRPLAARLSIPERLFRDNWCTCTTLCVLLLKNSNWGLCLLMPEGLFQSSWCDPNISKPGFKERGLPGIHSGQLKGLGLVWSTESFLQFLQANDPFWIDSIYYHIWYSISFHRLLCDLLLAQCLT